MPLTSAQVRTSLVDALKLDLIGPHLPETMQVGAESVETKAGLGDENEVLPQAPSRWYLTGFLAPVDSPPEQRIDEQSDDDLDSSGELGLDDDAAPEPAAASKQKFLPSSIGVSVLVPSTATHLTVEARWGDYKRRSNEDGTSNDEWRREQRTETITLQLPAARQVAKPKPIPNSDGLQLALSVQPVGTLHPNSGLPPEARTVSVFLVNRRAAKDDSVRDEAFAFQTELRLTAAAPFLHRPNTRGLNTKEWDEQVADLQYRDVGEYAVGHNVAAAGNADHVKTCWIPEAQVERVAPSTIPRVTLAMEELSKLPDGAAAEAALMPLVEQYRSWIEQQEAAVPAEPVERREVGNQLLDQASVAAARIERGIRLLTRTDCLRAFTLANEAMAMQARQRFGPMAGNAPADVGPPSWRPFQLAFLLMNLPGIAEPESEDREIVDLLFFPTGGGKTEAYLGLAAFTLILRRLRNPGIQGAGLCVLMRYTLRLLTLDQLSRGATLICALELLREQNRDLGDWRFEIGLWVGRAATPNIMGSKDQDYPETARRRTIDYGADSRKPSPIPLEVCPWCGTRFNRHSFRLMQKGVPNQSFPTDLEIVCANRDCPFIRERSLPILAVDDQIYRRLPCFMIATVDKFAGMPFTGATAGFFGKVQRFDAHGFYGPMTPDIGTRLPEQALLPPELIIQDELHLISGPLGTMVGLYETALESLASHNLADGRCIKPKIVASTATVRRAESQIQALFNRSHVDIFPPPGPDRRDSFFARTLTPIEGDQKTNARLYVGIAAQGRSPKVAMLRVYRALLGAGETSYRLSRKNKDNPADPYMTLLGYFNALRELGGARRLIEDEVRSQLERYGSRKRISEEHGLFVDRRIAYEPVELTSRISTAKVSEAKDTLGIPFSESGHADVAIATNMISVGLDITRLGLMVVFGQPKTSAEYIQATSRVGRDPERPGLVVTILNVHKPRDRSHYERFCAYHESFYRSVEATSVTPFSPRALDRGLAASVVSLARLGYEPLTAANSVSHIVEQRARLQGVVDHFADRASTYKTGDEAERDRERARVQERSTNLLDVWLAVVQQDQAVGTARRYNQYEQGTGPSLLKDFLDPDLRTKLPDSWEMKFRANRSLRDVEPSVNLWLRRLDQPRTDEDL